MLVFLFGDESDGSGGDVRVLVLGLGPFSAHPLRVLSCGDEIGHLQSLVGCVTPRSGVSGGFVHPFRSLLVGGEINLNPPLGASVESGVGNLVLVLSAPLSMCFWGVSRSGMMVTLSASLPAFTQGSLKALNLIGKSPKTPISPFSFLPRGLDVLPQTTTSAGEGPGEASPRTGPKADAVTPTPRLRYRN